MTDVQTTAKFQNALSKLSKPTAPTKGGVTKFHKGGFVIQKKKTAMNATSTQRTVFRIQRIDPKNLHDHVDAVRKQMGLNLDDVDIKTEATRHYFYDTKHEKYTSTQRFMAKVVFSLNRWKYMSLPWRLQLCINDLHVRAGNKENIFFEGCAIEIVGEGYTEACAVKSAIKQLQLEFEKTSKALIEEIGARQMSCECVSTNERRDWSLGDIMCRSCILQYEERNRLEQHRKEYEAYCSASAPAP